MKLLKRKNAFNSIISFLSYKPPPSLDLIKYWHDKGSGKKALEVLQTSSKWNSVQNMVACLVVGIIFPVNVLLFINNYKERGNYGLFWIEGDKQKAESTIGFAEQELDSTRSLRNV